MKTVEIYTDGACSGNPGRGGYAAILLYGAKKKIVAGGEKETTNNRMEMRAVIEALGALNQPCEVKIYSDSSYVVNAFNEGWLQNWQRTNFNNHKIKNIDLWEQLAERLKPHKYMFIKVKGHSDNEYNNECDRLAVAEVLKIEN